MNKSRTIAAKISHDRCAERGCVVLDQPQHIAKTVRLRILHAMRLVFDTAALLSVPVAIATLLLCPTSAHAQAGVPLWTNRYDGGSGGDFATAITVDKSGNVFVMGYSSNGSNDDYATIKYSADGVALWTNRYGGSGNGADTARAIAVDFGGNVFVTGISGGSQGTSDYATIKYSNVGTPLWTNLYKGLQGGNGAGASAIAVDGSGGVFVTGSFWSSNNSYYVYATVAYSSAGVTLWTNRYNGIGAGFSSGASAIAVDTSGNVFVTGGSYDEIHGVAVSTTVAQACPYGPTATVPPPPSTQSKSRWTAAATCL